MKAIIASTEVDLNHSNRPIKKVSTLSKDEIHMALQKTPTGGNARYFSWTWENGRLVITHSPELASHYLNRNENTSWVALGCLLTSVEVAAHLQGFDIQYIIFENLQTEISFKVSPKPLGLRDLFLAVIQRKTYRGPLKISAAPILHIQNQFSKVHVVESHQSQNRFIQFLIDSEAYLFQQKAATVDFLKELRFSKTFNPSTDRGIRAADLGVSKMDQQALQFFKKLPAIFSFLARWSPVRWQLRFGTRERLKNAHFMLVTTNELSPKGLIEAGRTAMKAWLELENMGYVAQPLSPASIPLVDAATSCLPADTLPKFRKLFTVTGPEILIKQFQLTADEKPVWLFRVGQRADPL